MLQKGVKFKWNQVCEKSLREIKQHMQSDVVLAYFDPKLPPVLAVDASPYGVGTILGHKIPDGTERPIQVVSQTLSNVLQKYSQIDRESLAIVVGVRQVYQNLFVQIFSPKKELPILSTSRMQHYAIFLQSFDFEIRVKASKDNGNADVMSRLVSDETDQCSSYINDGD